MTAAAAISLIGSTISLGLFAGLFYTWATGIIVGLRAVDDRTFATALASINTRMLNGWFVLPFGGPLAFTVWAGIVHLDGDRAVLVWTIAALVLYLLTVGITMSINIPLNNAVDRAAAHPDGIPEVRRQFLARWIPWNVARAVLSLGAFVAAIGALAVAT